MRKMLIVDDSSINREMMRENFCIDFLIIEASDGQEALDYLYNNYDVDIVLLDINMPGVDGYDVLRAIRKNKELSEIPVIAVTSVTSVDNQLKMLDAGASDIILKPFDPRITRGRVENLIGNRQYNEIKLQYSVLKEKNEAEENLKYMLDNISCGVVLLVVGEELKTEYINWSFYRIFGYDEIQNETSKTKIDYFIHVESIRELTDKIMYAALYNEAFEIQCKGIAQNGKTIYLQVHGTCLDYETGKKNKVLMSVFDVTQNKLAENEILLVNEKLEYRANHDALTGLLNREAFSEEAREMMNRNYRVKYAIVTINVEHFKMANELLGNTKADAILVNIANRLSEIVFKKGICGRLQSDHFIICAPFEFCDENFTDRKINELAKAVCYEYKISLNAGMYIADDINIPVFLMCDRANLALQTIKGNYLKRMGIYDDQLRKSLLNEQEVSEQMHQALDRRQFELYMQPVYNSATNEAISAEVLIRWKHPDKGLLFPGSFIPIFEKNGQIVDLDCYVIEETCRYIKKKIDHMEKLLPLSVNISRMSINSVNICEIITKLVRRYDIPSAFIKFEVTESAYTVNPKQLIDTLDKLHDEGFTILMDDFGSGYSSLNTLKDLPFDVLKIDMKFLDGFETSNKAGNILTSIVRMTKWLNIDVIAEGVETKDQVNYLKSIGCNRIQGYYYSKPLPIEKYEHKINEDIMIADIEETVEESYDMEINELFTGNEVISKLLNSMMTPMAIYEYAFDHIEVIRVNKKYCEILEYKKNDFIYDSKDTFNKIYPDDLDKFKSACEDAIACKGSIEIDIRRYTAKNVLKKFSLRITYMGQSGNQTLLAIAFQISQKNK